MMLPPALPIISSIVSLGISARIWFAPRGIKIQGLVAFPMNSWIYSISLHIHGKPNPVCAKRREAGIRSRGNEDAITRMQNLLLPISMDKISSIN